MKVGFNAFESFIERKHRLIVGIWLVIFIISIPVAIHLFSIVSYNITGSPSSNSSSAAKGQNIQLGVTVAKNVYSPQVKYLLLNISGKFGSQNVTSIYSLEYDVLNATYYQIRAEGIPLLYAEYQKYNVTPSTVSSALNASIIDSISIGITKAIENSTSLQPGPSLESFVAGAITGVKNETPQSVLYSENFSSYPVTPHQDALSALVNPSQNTTLFTVDYANYSYVSAYVSNISAKENATSYVTGSVGLTQNIKNETNIGTLLAIIIGIIAVIIATGFIFRSPIAAFIPLVIFGIDVTIAYAVFYLVFHFILNATISFFDPALTSILMLGVSTDYLVYMLYRYKQEHNKDNKKTISRTINGAGAAILVSGTTIIVAYAVLSAFNLAFIGSSGSLNSIGVFIVLLSAITLLPSLMFMFGDKLLYPDKKYHRRTENLFYRLANFDFKHRKKIVAFFVIVAVISTYIFMALPPGFNFLGLLPNSQAKQAFYVATNNFGYDPIDPLSIFISNSTANIQQIKANISAVSDVHSVLLSGSPGNYSLSVYMNSIAFSKPALYAYNSINTYLSSAKITYNISGTQAYLGSALDSTQSTVPTLLIALGIAIFIFLMIILFSVYTPLRLVILLISVIMTANALTILVFSSLFSLPFIIIAQVFLITNMMGVGVDYDIFLVMRIREGARRGLGNTESIKLGLAKSGPIVISIGAIFSMVFFSLIGSGVPIISEVGFIVGMGILLDSVISITILVPAVMFLLDKYNWWPSKRYERNKRHHK